MKDTVPETSALSDPDLLLEVRRLVGCERRSTVELIAALAEVDARRLYLGEGCRSLFAYCTQVLHLSEHATYGRIEAARAARAWPVILDLLADGSLHLTAVALLRPHLTAENHVHVLAAARHKSKPEVEKIVAALRPQPPVPSSVRKLSEPKPQAAAAADAPAAVVFSAPIKPAANVRPLAPERYKVQFTVTRETYEQLREAQDLLRHRIPSGDVGAIFARALTLLLEEVRRQKHAAVKRPRSSKSHRARGRHIPASVEREVWARDDGRCAFVGAQGRCAERGGLEFHHVIPFADGGPATTENLQLRCRAHNAYEAERWFGVGEEDFVREPRASWGGCPPTRSGPSSVDGRCGGFWETGASSVS